LTWRRTNRSQIGLRRIDTHGNASFTAKNNWRKGGEKAPLENDWAVHEESAKSVAFILSEDRRLHAGSTGPSDGGVKPAVVVVHVGWKPVIHRQRALADVARGRSEFVRKQVSFVADGLLRRHANLFGDSFAPDDQELRSVSANRICQDCVGWRLQPSCRHLEMSGACLV